MPKRYLEQGRGDRDKPFFNTPEARMLRGLFALGHRIPEELEAIMMGQRNGCHIHAQVVALYDKLSGTPGDSEQNRAEGFLYGWAPPLAWYDASRPANQEESSLYNSGACPNGYPFKQHARCGPSEDVKRKMYKLVMAGYTVAEIMAELQVSKNSVNTFRASIPEDQRPTVRVDHRTGKRTIMQGVYNRSGGISSREVYRGMG